MRPKIKESEKKLKLSISVSPTVHRFLKRKPNASDFINEVILKMLEK